MHLGIIKITYKQNSTTQMLSQRILWTDRVVNLGAEVILTLLWQSGTSESATVCFVISLSIDYWLLKCGVLRVVCVCVRLCVCVWEREREREREGHSAASCVCSCVWERETRSHHNRGLFANTYELHHCVCHATLFPSQAWTDGKTKDIINCLYIYFESWSSRLWKGTLHFRLVLVVFRPITMLWVSWPIRADCACRKEGLCRKRSVWERRGIDNLQ